MDVDAVGDFEHMRHVVGDQDDRQPPLLDVENELEHAARLLDAERRRRLVHDDDSAREGRCASDRDPLALAPRQRLDRLTDVLDRHQPKFVELLARKLLHGGAVERAKEAANDPSRSNLASEEHIIGDRQRRRQRQVLVDSLDTRLARFNRRPKVHDIARKADFAGVGNHGAANSLDERRLSGAVIADDREDLARIEIEVGVVERGDAAVAFDELAAGEDGFDAHFETLRIHWSSATATMMSTPIANSCQSTSSPASDTAERNTPTISAPTRVPTIEPRPPNRLVPPITTAVMLSRLPLAPAVGLIAPMRPISAQPAIAAMSPASVYTLSKIRSVSMPASRAASGSSPVA